MEQPSDPTVAVVLAGGDPLPPDVRPVLPAGALVVAADSGLALAEGLGLTVHLVVGDLDSVDPDLLTAAELSGTVVERHPAAKDHTDLALALDRARAAGVAEVVVVGGHGGRLDHLLANALALAAPELAGVRLRAHLGEATVAVVRPGLPAVLVGAPGDLVSLLPPHGVARGVRTEGLAYPLRDEDLAPGSTRGVSNELARPTATVAVADGVLLAVQPGGAGTHLATGLAPGAADGPPSGPDPRTDLDRTSTDPEPDPRQEAP